MADKHFYEQQKHTVRYLIPYFDKHLPNFREMNILEVGCAEGGFMEELEKLNINTTGLEISEGRVKIANTKSPNLNILCGDITDAELPRKIGQKFDMVVMRDTIEHVPNRKATFENISRLLNPGGYLYVTFPPRFSGFAGHQQNCKSFLKFVPYLHYLPDFAIYGLGRLMNEKKAVLDDITLNYKIGLSIHAFEKFYKRGGFKPIVKELFLSRPVFKVRYNLSTVKVPAIPLLREFFAFGCEYLLKKEPHADL